MIWFQHSLKYPKSTTSEFLAKIHHFPIKNILMDPYKQGKFQYHGGLSQWGRSNRPRIRPGTERAMGVVIVSPLCQENWPLSYVSLVRATYCTEHGQYKLLSDRPVQTGQVLFEFKFTTAQSDTSISNKFWIVLYSLIL